MADEERKGITPGQWDAISNVEKPAEEGGGRVFDEVLKERSCAPGSRHGPVACVWQVVREHGWRGRWCAGPRLRSG